MSSTTATKITLAEATVDAAFFRELFAGTYDRWEVAGSVRRRVAAVGDVEHVVIPRWGTDDVTGLAALFSGPDLNLLWARADALVSDGTLRKHVYGTSGFRWGQKLRGIDYHGTTHEIYTADADNWGPQLAIRTGPWEMSRSLVTALRRRGRRNIDGYVWTCRKCVAVVGAQGNQCGENCELCEGTGLVPLERLSVPSEREYFELCGMPWAQPRRKGDE